MDLTVMFTFQRFSRPLAAVVAVAAIACMGAPFAARADDATAVAKVIDDLRSKTTRGVSVTAANAAREAEEVRVLENLKAIARDRSLSAGERTQLTQVTAGKPLATFNVPFGFNSAVVETEAKAQLDTLGKALQSGQIKSSDFVLAGHTDAKGKAAYNLQLSQRRAEAVRSYLTATFGLASEKLIAVGYGREKPLDARKPYADENRRVEVINVTTTATASR